MESEETQDTALIMPLVLSEGARISWMSLRTRILAIKSDCLRSPIWTNRIMNTLWTKWEGTRNKAVFLLLLLARLWDLLAEVIMLTKITNMTNTGHQSWDLSTISTMSAWVKTMDYPVKEFDWTSITTVKKNFLVTVETTGLHCQTTEATHKDTTICSRIKMERK